MKEKLIKQIMAEALADGEPMTREEAEEVAEMEIKAKGMKHYEQSAPTKGKTKREIKKDPEKVEIIKKIYDFLLTDGFEDAIIVNEQREITFKDFSITLTKHRPKKGV